MLIVNENSPVQETDVLTYSPETKHLFSKQDQYFFEVTTLQMPTQPKYFRVQKQVVTEATEKRFLKKPEMPLRQVIRKVLKGMPDFLTGENLVQVVTYITGTWAKCQAEASKQADVPTEMEAVS